MNRRRLIRRVNFIFKLVSVCVILSSISFGYGVWNMFMDVNKVEIKDSKFIPKTCNKKVYKARWDCRKLLVDNHYGQWKKNKEIIKTYCDYIATEMYCEDING